MPYPENDFAPHYNTEFLKNHSTKPDLKPKLKLRRKSATYSTDSLPLLYSSLSLNFVPNLPYFKAVFAQLSRALFDCSADWGKFAEISKVFPIFALFWA
jgi:hypothetical protein